MAKILTFKEWCKQEDLPQDRIAKKIYTEWLDWCNNQKVPVEWIPRPVDTKSGWKNNAKVLAEIVTAINNDTYVEDESEMMEKIDVVLEWMKSRYQIRDRYDNKKLKGNHS